MAENQAAMFAGLDEVKGLLADAKAAPKGLFIVFGKPGAYLTLLPDGRIAIGARAGLPDWAEVAP